MRRLACVAVALLVIAFLARLAPAARGPGLVPRRLVDVRGTAIDVATLASGQRLFFVTLKTTSCPVCRMQLQRLRTLRARLQVCGAVFVVLAPGPRDALTRIADESGLPYPFVEDVDLAIAEATGLRLAADHIEPAIFEVNARGEVVWIDRGRTAERFNDGALLEHLRCDESHRASGARGWPPRASS